MPYLKKWYIDHAMGKLHKPHDLFFKKSSFVYLFDLFEHKKYELMKAIEEFEYPTKDRTKNYILQLEDKGVKKGMKNVGLRCNYGPVS